MDLNKIMEVDHVIRVHADGSVAENVPGVYAPELYIETDEEGSISDAAERDMITMARALGWELLTGWTGQHLYSGAFMHVSEYVGGRLADHILSTPGLYVVTIPSLLTRPDDDSGDDPAGWVVAYREEI